MRQVRVEGRWKLGDYAAVPRLAHSVRELRSEAAILVPGLRGRTVWMINSTEKGGGVAEMLPRVVALLDELGVRTRWALLESRHPEFFRLTKRLHNAIHGEGDAGFSEADRQIYEAVNRENADRLRRELKPGDILVVHDPQPLPLGAMLRRALDVRFLWRCHIGHDEHVAATRAAWRFLRPWAEACDHGVFSAPEYIPDFLAGRAAIIDPALDPASHKNRDLPPHKLAGILCNARLQCERHPVLTPPFPHPALRVDRNGELRPPDSDNEIGLLYRPIVTQVSRWDRLKGFAPLLEGFVRLKHGLDDSSREWEPRRRRRIELLRLVLAGPDPASVADDPEGAGVLDELIAAYRRLPARLQGDVALLALPMESRKANALMVNALQRCSTVVVQNSLKEGFGLTATEAMWKGVPVVGTRASGLRRQIRSGIDGMLIQDPTDPDEVARRLDAVLSDAPKRDRLAASAQRRVHEKFLIFTQLRQWLVALTTCVERGGPPSADDSD